MNKLPLLVVENVSKRFGGVEAVRDVSFSVDNGVVMGIIGPNGSGKTTLLNLISGVEPLTAGKILFREKRLDGLPPDRVTESGIAKTHQIPRPFNEMSVRENVAVAVMYGARRHAPSRDAMKEADTILSQVDLDHKKNILARNLTVQEKKRLELARAIATRPSLLLLDEVFAGLSPDEVRESMQLFRNLKKELNFTAIIVEHVLRAVLGLADSITVLHEGEKIAEGDPKSIVENIKVVEAYLGAAS